jgi:hypothetical protein
MANLLNQNIGLNYQGILNLQTINTPLSTTVQNVSDGTGQNSPLQLGTNSVRITGGNLFVDSNLFNAGFIEAGRLISTTTATASTPPVSITGGWFSGGSATTTKPQLLIEPTGTTSTAWSTSGTGLGINAANSFTGNLIDSQINGVSKFSIDINGNVAANIIYNRGISFRDTGAFIASDANNQIKVYTPGAGAGDPMFLQIGGNTVTYPALKRNNTNIEIKLANDSAYTGLNTGILSVLNAGASGVSPIYGSGTWFTGGGTTNTKPYALIEPSGTTSTSWNNSGTGLGINAASSFTGNFVDLQLGGVSKLTINSVGTVSAAAFVSNGQYYGLNAGSIVFVVDGVIQLRNNAASSFDRLQFGGSTTSFPALKRNSANLEVKFANDTFGAGLSVGASLVASAILQADSTTQGFLPPRMTGAQRGAITSPATGLIVFDTTADKLYVKTAAGWQTITSV